MQGDTIVIEQHHRQAAAGVTAMILPLVRARDGRFTLTVAGESGAGKSEIASAIAEALEDEGIRTIIFQQDDYFVYPPKTNDRTRREDINWVGPQEVRLDLLSEHLATFLSGADSLEKPLVNYADDVVNAETLQMTGAQVGIAEGTYTSKLDNVDVRVFIDRDFRDTRKHRERRNRDAAELDSFTDDVLAIEHDIIAADKAVADIIINRDYTVTPAG